MKVNLGPYPSHWSTRYVEEAYLEKMHKVEDSYSVEKENYTKLDKVVIWLLDKWQDVLNATVNEYFHWRGRKEKVHIDGYDVWSADHTLALIIHPTLVKLRSSLHGSPNTDDEDVPEELRSTSATPKENDWDIDDNHFKRWDWIIDEMIWAFEQELSDDSENQFYSGEADYFFEKVKDSNLSVFEMKEGEKHSFKIDTEGLENHHKRMKNGFRLFGKYYQALWD